jgi:hypothetical protein
VARELADRVGFVGVSYRDTVRAGRAYQRRFDATYPLANDASGRTWACWRVPYQPVAVLVDKQGRIAERFDGGTTAGTLQETDWSQIVALYDHLLAVAPTPVVALNRTIAVGELQGPAAALALVDELDLDNYHPFHATRADLLRRLGRDSEAAAAYQRAATMAPTDAERDFLRLGGRASR